MKAKNNSVEYWGFKEKNANLLFYLCGVATILLSAFARATGMSSNVWVTGLFTLGFLTSVMFLFKADIYELKKDMCEISARIKTQNKEV